MIFSILLLTAISFADEPKGVPTTVDTKTASQQSFDDLEKNGTATGGALKVMKQKQVKALQKKVEKKPKSSKNVSKCSDEEPLNGEKSQGCKVPK